MKTSGEPLAVDVEEDEMNVGTPSSTSIDKEDTAGSGNRPSKRAKKDENVVDPLVHAFELGTQTITGAIRDAASKRALPPGLFEAVDSLPGFELEHKAKYYSYLLNNPNVAQGFVEVPLLYKLSMLTEFINGNM